MSLESIKHTSIKSPSDRLKGSFGNAIFGLFLLLGGMVLLFWNEGRAIKRIRVLEDGRSSVVELVEGQSLSPEHDGKLVYMNALASSSEMLKDTVFNMNFAGIALTRHVEMYQWRETKETSTREDSDGNEVTTTTYSYDKEWCRNPQLSANFMHPNEHQNPPMQIVGETFHSGEVRVNDVVLSNSLVSKIDNEQRVALNDWEIPEMFEARAQILEDKLYLGNNPQKPEIGDFKIWFSSVSPCTVSVIAQLQNGRLDTYYSDIGKLELLKTGSFTSDELFDSAEKSNSLMTWGLRICGWLLVWVGCATCFSLLDILAAFVPVLGGLLRRGIGVIVFGIASCISVLTISVGWIIYRPLIGLSLAGIGLVFLLLPLLKKKTV